MISYDTYVTRYSDSFKRVVIDKEYYKKIKSFVNELIIAKSKEGHHIIDNKSEAKRFTTGLLGEAALEKHLGIKIIDWTIGESNYYHHPDIPGYNVGIKTVEKGKFPIIFKDNRYPQIICIRSDRYANLIFICGLATPETLNKYQSDDLIVDKQLKARGTKTGFYGFDKLTEIKTIKDIDKYKKGEC